MSKEKLVPVGPRILVRGLDENEEMTEGGIIIPETSRNTKVKKYEVVSVGDGYRNPDGGNIPLGVEVGEVVITSVHSGTEVLFDRTKLFLITEEDILAKVTVES